MLIAGLGSVGQRHVRNLRALVPDVRIVAYRERGHPLPDDLREGGIAEVDTLAEALAHGPDAALVCNPTSRHFPVAMEAARAGCHLLIEKPVSHTLDGLSELRSEVARRGVRVLIGFQWRFHPAIQMVRRLVTEGAIGRVLHAEAHWGECLRDWHPWEDYRTGYSARADLGGGTLLTLCHPFDYLRWIVGEVTAVAAQAGHLSRLEIDVEDCTNALLFFAGGAMGVVHLDYVQSPPVHRLEIVGEDGAIRWDDSRGEVHLVRSEQQRIFPVAVRRNEMFLHEMRHFVACVTGSAIPAVSLEDGIAVLAIVVAAKRSARDGRTVEVEEVLAS